MQGTDLFNDTIKVLAVTNLNSLELQIKFVQAIS